MLDQPEPSDGDLVAFAASLLQNLGPHLREPRVLEQAVAHHRETWVLLYRTSRPAGETRPGD